MCRRKHEVLPPKPSCTCGPVDAGRCIQDDAILSAGDRVQGTNACFHVGTGLRIRHSRAFTYGARHRSQLGPR